MNLSENIWLYGSEEPLPPRRKLKVGSLSADFIEGQLRNIKLGDILILQRIYSAVRDENWATIAGQLTILEDYQTDNALHLAFECIHQHGDIDFHWLGTIHMTPMSMSFEMDGQAYRTFKRNRIGFCVLHDASVAGSECHLELVDGSYQDAQFPRLIAPHQPFFNLRAITHQPSPNLQVTVRMEGDIFEMEDQRNWTDASFKTYCTPLRLPFPIIVEKGTRIQQRIELTWLGDVPILSTADDQIIVIRATDQFTRLPSIGTCYRGDTLTSEQENLLDQIKLNHYRLDFDLASDNLKQQLDNAHNLKRNSKFWNFEVVLWLSDNPRTQLENFASLLNNHRFMQNVFGFTIFVRGQKCTSQEILALADELLPSRPVYGGTDAFFTELNRERPNFTTKNLNGVSYSTNPQVHAFDNDSLIETLSMQGETLRSTRAFITGSWSINVSPISLKMRWNPNATGDSTPTPIGELPTHVDTRQMSLFGAVWTLGSLIHNIANEASRVTYYATHGYDGLMPYMGENRLSHLFHDTGLVYPLYHVFAVLPEDGDVQNTISTQPLKAEALYIWSGDELLILIANYTPYQQSIELEGMSGNFRAKELSLRTVEEACADPLKFIETWTKRHKIREERFQIMITPYSIYFMEQDESYG